MDYYSILGVNRNATPEEIKKAYRKLAMQHHPDRTGGDDTRFKQINEAYDTLSNPEKKQHYDNPQPQYRFDTSGMGGGFEDVFSQMFGGGPRMRPRPQIKNSDVNLFADITLKELFTGKNLFLTYSLRNGQQERVEVNIPRGVEDGQLVRFKGLGDDSIRDLPRGDLYVKIRVRNRGPWKKDGIDLYLEKTVNVFDLMIGTEINVDTPEEKSLVLKIPTGTQPGTTFSIHGYGIPDLKRGKRGILYVKIKGIVPKITDSNIIKKLEKLKNATS